MKISYIKNLSLGIPYQPWVTQEQKKDRIQDLMKELGLLPIMQYQHAILKRLEENDVCIITAETWAGKSTQVPQFLYKAGYNVIITQPRRLAATSLAARVSDEMWVQLGEAVWYQLGWHTDSDKKFGKSTGIKFCTDGLQLVKQLAEQSLASTNGRETVLVIDEVHERNQNIEVLIARSKKMKQDGKKIKIVLMSATMDAQKLASYFAHEKSDVITGEKTISHAPLVQVPGRLYPVTETQQSAKELVTCAVELAKKGRNVLVFQPGKKEIQETIDELAKQQTNAIILPLHGELTKQEQDRIFKIYNQPVIIVSTNIAQTSLTIPYIDAVVDSGLERRIKLIDNIESLVLWTISKADSKQRAGRAGRVKEWMYILCNDNNKEYFDEYPTPEIQRTRIDLNYLKILAETWLHMEELDFFHPVSKESLQQTKEILTLLWAIDEQWITSLWKKLSHLPVDPSTGRMLIQAAQNGCLYDMMKIAAIREVGSLIDHKNAHNIPSHCENSVSDLLTQLKLYEYAITQRIGFDFKKAWEAWINSKSFQRVKESYEHIKEAINIKYPQLLQLNKWNQKNEWKSLSTTNEQDLLKSIAAGMLWSVRKHSYGKTYENNKWDSRDFDNKSSVESSDIIIADPKNIVTKNRKWYDITISLLTNISYTTTAILRELAPHLYSHQDANIQRNLTEQYFERTRTHIFNALSVEQEQVKADTDLETIQQFCEKLAAWSSYITSASLQDTLAANNVIMKKLRSIVIRTGGVWKWRDLSHLWTTTWLASHYQDVLYAHSIDKTSSLEGLFERIEPDSLQLNPLHILLPDIEKIEKQYPETIVVDDQVFQVSYAESEPKIRINATIEQLEYISDDMFDSYFEGKKAGNNWYGRDFPSTSGYVYNIAQFKQQHETNRLEKERTQWSSIALVQSWTTQEFDVLSDSTIQSHVYDTKTHAMTRSGLKMSGDQISSVRYRDEQAAIASREQTLANITQQREAVRLQQEKEEQEAREQAEQEVLLQARREQCQPLVDLIDEIEAFYNSIEDGILETWETDTRTLIEQLWFRQINSNTLDLDDLRGQLDQYMSSLQDPQYIDHKKTEKSWRTFLEELKTTYHQEIAFRTNRTDAQEQLEKNMSDSADLYDSKVSQLQDFLDVNDIRKKTTQVSDIQNAINNVHNIYVYNLGADSLDTITDNQERRNLTQKTNQNIKTYKDAISLIDNIMSNITAHQNSYLAQNEEESARQTLIEEDPLAALLASWFGVIRPQKNKKR